MVKAVVVIRSLPDAPRKGSLASSLCYGGIQERAVKFCRRIGDDIDDRPVLAESGL